MNTSNLKNKMIEFLLDNGNPSIRYRIKKEILNSISETEEKDLLDQIFLEENIQTIVKSQKADGWLGNNFHGSSGRLGAGMYDNMEVGTRYLAEKGIPSDNAIFKGIMHAFLTRPKDDTTYNNCGKEDDDYSYTCQGLYLARSSVILRAGYEYLLEENRTIDLPFDIKFSLDSFANVLNYCDTELVLDTYRNTKCFKESLLWPCAYHLRILAFSREWRNNDNILLLSNAVKHLFELPQDGAPVYTKIRNFLKAPCDQFIHRQIMGHFESDFVDDRWFDRMELFARCGIIKHVEHLQQEYEHMIASIHKGTGICDVNVDKKAFQNWGPYGGLQLEVDWKTKTRKLCDITFRALMIMHYAHN